MSASQYLINSESRTFIRQYTDACSKYDYYASTVVDTLSQENGDISASYYPDFKYGVHFEESATIISNGTRPTVNIIGRIPRNFNSKLYQLSTNKNSANFQLHFGRCYNPTIFNDFDEAVILEDARVITYSTDKMGSLGREESAVINETVSISVGHWYTIHKLAFNNIGTKIITDGYRPLSMDILECDECFDSDQYCTIFVLARSDFDPLFNPLRVYITQDNGKTWRYVELPLDIHDAYIISAPFSTITVFDDYVYLHLKTSIIASKIFSMPTKDILYNAGVWTINAVTNQYSNIYASDRIIKFKNNFFAPYVDDLTPVTSDVSRIVRFGSLVDRNYTVSYVPKTNTDVGVSEYHDTPLYLYNYKNQILFSGLYIGHMLGSDPKKLYVAYTTDGYRWIEVPIIINGQQVSVTNSTHIHIAPITNKHWLVTVVTDGQPNTAYCTLNGGKTWKAIPAAFKGNGFLATYIPTESILFSDKYRSYDSGITTVALPDKDSEVVYDTIIEDGITGSTFGRAFGCRNNPNQMFTYGDTGVFLFN